MDCKQHRADRGSVRNLVATFSIAAFDPETGDLGVAVQSKFLAVGAVVPWVKAGIGAVATQAFANTSYGPVGLELLASGKSPEETVEVLTDGDEERDHRQLGIIDARGRSATYTGGKCFDWAGGTAGEGFAAQGNILVGEDTVGVMAEAFRSKRGGLAGRLISALDAGQGAGGDSRGRQSAAIVVERKGGGYGGFGDRVIDLRVDDHPEPIEELRRLHGLHGLYFGEVRPEDIVLLEGEHRERAQTALRRLGYLGSGGPVSAKELQGALEAFVRIENFEEREQQEGYVDLEVLRFLEARGSTRESTEMEETLDDRRGERRIGL